MCLEIFAGSGNLSAALGSHPLFAACPVDLVIDEERHDLLKDENFQFYLRALETGAVCYLHLALPCSTFSMARWPKIRSKMFPRGLPARLLSQADRQRLRESNKLTERAFRLAIAAGRAGCMVTVENPKNSLLWHHPAYHKWTKAIATQSWCFDMCRFGTPYLKPTKIVADAGLDLSVLALSCDHPDRHVRLSGWRAFPGHVCIPTRQKSAEYPLPLARAWAAAIVQHFVAKGQP